jgi:H+/Cl- antiporter ClcA
MVFLALTGGTCLACFLVSVIATSNQLIWFTKWRRGDYELDPDQVIGVLDWLTSRKPLIYDVPPWVILIIALVILMIGLTLVINIYEQQRRKRIKQEQLQAINTPVNDDEE